VIVRARDTAFLADRHDRTDRLVGQVTRTTGSEEWGAWLGDYAVATLSVRPHATSREIFGEVAAVFGPSASRVADTLEALSHRLDDALESGHLAGYLAGDDDLAGGRVRSLATLGASKSGDDLVARTSRTSATAFGATPASGAGPASGTGTDLPASAGSLSPHLAGPSGMATQTPSGDDLADARIPFARLNRMGDEALTALERSDLARLDMLASDLDGYADALSAAHTDGVPEAAAPLLAELADGTRIDALRTRHVLALYRQVIESRRAHLTVDPVSAGAHRTSALTAARLAANLRMQALAIVSAQEARYRHPPERTIAGYDPTEPDANATVYPFRILARPHLLADWSRREMLADNAAQGSIDDRLLRITVPVLRAAESVIADAAVLDSAGWRSAGLAFGDDTPAQPLPAGSPHLTHQYARTGAYEVTLTATDATGAPALFSLPIAVVATQLAVPPGALGVNLPSNEVQRALMHTVQPLMFGVIELTPSTCRLALSADDDADGVPDPGRLTPLPPGPRSGDHCSLHAPLWALPVGASTAGDALPARDLALEADLGPGTGLPTSMAGTLRMSLRRADLATLLGLDQGLEPAQADAALARAWPDGDWLPVELDFTGSPTR
jgi:hypothetical protein